MVDAAPSLNSREVAVVGMACHLPGGVRSPEDLWRRLLEGFDAVSEVPAYRWSVDARYSADADEPGKISSRWAGCLDDVDCFDAAFFGVSPREAAQMDPQQRIALQVGYEALERAGIPLGDPLLVEGGVFMGASGSDYGRRLGAETAEHDAYFSTGQASSIIANRLSYAFDMRGPSWTVDTACSSSLVALHQAARSVATGECEVALAGGVNLVLATDMWVSLSKFGMMSPRGRCHSFGADADGFVRSDGCGVVVLKPLARALDDGDAIQAVILGSAVNQDGRSNGLTAPNGRAQEAVIRRALAASGTDARDVSYLEAHGSGTPLGDRIEMGALERIYGSGRDEAGPCGVGSIKSNIGHAEAAAGIAGFLKLVLCLRNGRLPASLHAEELNPELPLGEGALEVVRDARPWDAARRVGAVSSFGFGGTNVHLIAEAHAPVSRPRSTPSRHARVLPLSARDDAALRELAGAYADTLDDGTEDLLDLCYTAGVRRTQHGRRAAFAAPSREELARALRDFAGSSASDARGAAPAWRDPVFVFAGQGREYAGMGRALLEEPAFAAHVAECEEPFRDALGISVTAALRGGDPDRCPANRTDVAQAALFALQTGIAATWQAFGVTPAAVLGHSAGEAAAAHVAGLLDLPSAVRLVAARGRALQRTAGLGRMAAAATSVEEAAQAPGIEERRVVVAVDNAPSSVVLAGETAALSDAIEWLEERRVRVVRLPGQYAFHSPLVGEAADEFAEALEGMVPGAATVPLISSITGGLLPAGEGATDFWARGVTGRVRFREAVATAAEAGFDNFLELGPHPTLAPAVVAAAGAVGVDASVAHGHHLDGEGAGGVREALPDLFSRGQAIDWRGVYPTGRFLPEAPTYPWRRERFWALREPEAASGGTSPSPRAEDTARQSGESGGDATHTPPHEGHRMATDLRPTIKETLAGNLGCRADEIDERTGFLDLGADSVILLRVVSVLADQHGVRLQVSELFEDYPTVEAVAEAFADQAQACAFADRAEPGAFTDEAASTAASPSMAEAPLAAANEAAAGTSAAERIVRGQLEVMREQLRLLGEDNTAADQASPPPAAPIIGAAGGPDPAPGPDTATHGPAPRPETVGRPRSIPPAPALDGPQRELVGELADELSSRSPESKALAERGRTRFVESRPWQSFRAQVKELLVPVVMDQAAGSRIWDIDGAEYTDYCLGFGVHLLGHNPPFVTQAVERQLHRAYSLGPQSTAAYEVAEQLCRITGSERAAFCNSGSEAVMGAIRLARWATGRQKVAYFDKSYHGITDTVLGQMGATQGAVLPSAPGVSEAALADAVILPYGDPSSLEYLRAHGSDLAAVLVEPVQNRDPGFDPGTFLAELRECTRQTGTVLVFDEMITGFRVGLRGAQGHFDVTPDLTTYGKVLGGGLPLAAIAGSAAALDGFDGGAWRYGDDSAPSTATTMFGGTFQRHPLAMAAAGSVLTHLEEHGDALYEDLNSRARRITDALTEIIEREGLPCSLERFGSMWRLQYRGLSNMYQPLQLEMLYHTLRSQGIYVWEGRTFFLSTAHDDRDAERLVATFEDGIERLRAAEFLPPESASAPARAEPSAEAELTANAYQRDLWQRCEDAGSHSVAQNEAVTVDLRGPLNVDALRTALEHVTQRHPALRSTFAPDGNVLRVWPSAPELETVDLRDTDEARLSTAVDEAVCQRAHEPYDLTRGPLFRPLLVRTALTRHVLALCAHHLVMDGQSFAAALSDLAACYRDGVAADTREVVWPSATHATSSEESASYWRDRLASLGPSPDWTAAAAGDDGRPGTGRHMTSMDPELWAAISDRSAGLGCTPFMVMFAAFAHVLHGLCAREDLVIGTPVDQRAGIGTAADVGHCANIVPVRSEHAGGEHFTSYLGRLRRNLLDDLSHGAVPLGDIAALASPAPERADDLVEVVFDLNPPLAMPPWGDVEAELGLPPIQEPKHALFFDVIPTGDGALVDVTHKPAVGGGTVERICRDWTRLLADVTARAGHANGHRAASAV